ncbi:MAG: PEP-CTERM sorting domain-containing protein [Burkholderiaceae bacterium]|nr:PEP-CTERM sorting domain-containing protein [Burkholderiaceae bacterium]
MSYRRLIATATLAALTSSAQALVSTWDGSSDLLPEQVDPSWTLIDEGAGSPSFAGGVLTIQTTSTHGARQYYTMGGTDLDFTGGAPYWLEAEMKYISGSQTSGWWRAPGHMSFRFESGRIAVLEIRKDLIYIRNGDNSAGDSAVVDTDEAFHTYRMEALGTAAGTTVNVYQDGLLVLSDNALYAAGGGASVSWGEASTLATGTTQWKRVSHNMAAVAVTPVPEPGTWALWAAGLAAVGFSARRNFRQQIRA